MPEITDKAALFAATAAHLQSQGFRLADQDQTRPWGGFFVIDESQAQAFADAYFDGLPADSLRIAGKLSPKMLLVAPQQRLSWQYHFRRAEIWKVVQGPVGVATSPTDEEGEVKSYEPGALIVLDNVVREGGVIDPDSTDPNVPGTRAVHEALAQDSRVTWTTVQTVGVKKHDGFTIALVN